MKIEPFLHQLTNNPGDITFLQTMETIDRHYCFTPTSFCNGDQQTEPRQNNGSCKIFSFAQINKLSEQQTLSCFGEYYRDEVLNQPEGQNHQNIRQFMIDGWSGIEFSGKALKPR